MATVGIAGAGLMGRLLAFRLAEAGWHVTLFDENPAGDRSGCSFVAAGMLTPLAELEKAEPVIADLGMEALALWPQLLARLARPVFFQRTGSLVVAHRQDMREMESFRTNVRRKLTAGQVMDEIGGNRLTELEPELGIFSRAIYFPDEGQIDPRQLMPALEETLHDCGVTWHYGTRVESLAPGSLKTEGGRVSFDQVLDTRGLGARRVLTGLRGVRGELLRVQTPEVGLNRPIRLIHPRYPLYIVPRPGGHYLIGATSIESDDTGPITVRSSLELLSAAYSLHPGFAEARVLESTVQCRPALPDNLPSLSGTDGLLRINGLYRHGFLIAPAIAEDAVRLLSGEPLQFPQLAEVEYAQTHR